MIHGVFYISLAVFSAGLSGLLTDPDKSHFWYGILGLGVLSVIPLTAHYLAARLHRAYCAQHSPPAGVAVEAAGVDRAVSVGAIPTA